MRVRVRLFTNKHPGEAYLLALMAFSRTMSSGTNDWKYRATEYCVWTTFLVAFDILLLFNVEERKMRMPMGRSLYKSCFCNSMFLNIRVRNDQHHYWLAIILWWMLVVEISKRTWKLRRKILAPGMMTWTLRILGSQFQWRNHIRARPSKVHR